MRTHSSALNAARRERELAEATDGRVVDLLVVGLGVTGAGVALDAASRGLDVVAVDAHDLAFGTSRWSSKLVHGGLRYLAQGQVRIAHQSAVERGVLMTTTAPHLTRALPMVLPLLPTVSHRQAAVAASGLVAGNLLRACAHTSRRTLPRPRRLDATETRMVSPDLRTEGLRGALLSWDGQLEDDARLVVALARTAAAHGARVLTGTRALALTGAGATTRDERGGRTTQINARAVVNATGVWAGELSPHIALRPSRGTHLVLRGSTLPGLRAAVTAAVPGEAARYTLVLPQADGRVYAGLTDEPVDGPVPDVPEPSDAEVDFLLDAIGAVFDRPIRRDDVVGAFAGLRPLVEGDGRTADLSRQHVVVTGPDHVVTVIGGKLTTYRQMAEDAVDAVVDQAGLVAGRCRTRRLPLVGAASRAALRRSTAAPRLVRRYGAEADAVLQAARTATGGDVADSELLAPVADGVPVTRAELLFGVTHEGAHDAADLLDRRTRIGLVAQDRALAEPSARTAVQIGHAMSSRPHPPDAC